MTDFDILEQVVFYTPSGVPVTVRVICTELQNCNYTYTHDDVNGTRLQDGTGDSVQQPEFTLQTSTVDPLFDHSLLHWVIDVFNIGLGSENPYRVHVSFWQEDTQLEVQHPAAVENTIIYPGMDGDYPEMVGDQPIQILDGIHFR